MKSRYQDLKVWQKSFELVKIVYVATKNFPQEERFGLALQMRRAAVSIPSNIAEGKGRDTDKDFKRFLYMAKGSCNELETQTLIALELCYITGDIAEDIQQRCQEILKMLSSLITTLANS